MSLVRLLTAGKSLVGIKNDPTSRYQMRSRYLLPRFGSAKNPFAAPPTTAATAAPQPAPAAAAVRQPALPATQSPAEIAAANLKETKRLSLGEVADPVTKLSPSAPVKAEAVPVASVDAPPATASAVVPVVAPVAALPVPRPSGWLKFWLRRLNPLAWWTRRTPGLKSVLPRFNRSAVQGELSLEKIKVVRNDLNDGDMELVAARPVPRAKPRTARPVEEQAELAETPSN